MTTNASFDDRLSAWLRETSEHRVSHHLDEVLVVTAATRQRRWWSSPERWLPMDMTTRASTLAPAPIGRLILVGLLILALAAAAIIAVGSQSRRLPPPFGPAANGELLSWDNGDIYVSAADGSNRHPLIAGPTRDSAGLHSHDGTRFVFLRSEDGIDSQLLMANADGTVVRPILDELLARPDKIEWSPQDDRLAIVHLAQGTQVLSILDLATGSLRHLPVPGLNVDYNVLWQPPDGDELLFTARADAASSTGAAIYAIRPDGTGLRTVVAERPEEWPFLGLDFAPDGRTLTYWMYEEIAGQPDLHARVHLVDMASNQDRPVVFDPENTEESELAFSPDGRTGLILSATDTATLQLVTLDPIGPGPAIGPRLVGDETKSSGFSPDGRTVVLAVDQERPIFIDVDTLTATTLDEVWGRLDSWQRLAAP